MKCDRRELAQLIPHRDAMCLLEHVDTYDADSIVCRAVNHRDPAHPLRSGGRLPALMGIEYGAQAMAVHGGLLSRDAGAGTAAPGFLAAVRGVTLHVDRLDDVDGDLLVRAVAVHHDQRLLTYDFALSADERLLVEGRVTVALAQGAAR